MSTYHDLYSSIQAKVKNGIFVDGIYPSTDDLSEIVHHNMPVYVGSLMDIVKSKPEIAHQTPDFEGTFFELLSYAIENSIVEDLTQWLEEEYPREDSDEDGDECYKVEFIDEHGVTVKTEHTMGFSKDRIPLFFASEMTSYTNEAGQTVHATLSLRISVDEDDEEE